MGSALTALQLAFLALKLTGQLQWTWVQIFLPTIVPVVIVGAVTLLFLAIWRK